MINISNSKIIFNIKKERHQINNSIKISNTNDLEASFSLYNFIKDSLEKKEYNNLENLFLNFNNDNIEINKLYNSSRIESEKDTDLSLEFTEIYNNFINQNHMDKDSIENNIHFFKLAYKKNDNPHLLNLPVKIKYYFLSKIFLDLILIGEENKDILNSSVEFINSLLEKEKNNKIITLINLIKILIDNELGNELNLDIFKNEENLKEIMGSYYNFSIFLLIINLIILKNFSITEFHKYILNLSLEFFKDNIIYEDNNNYKLLINSIIKIIELKHKNNVVDENDSNTNIKILRTIKLYNSISIEKLSDLIKIEKSKCEKLVNEFYNNNDNILDPFYSSFLDKFQINNYELNDNLIKKSKIKVAKNKDVIIEDLINKLNLI